MRPQLLDRFGMCVNVATMTDTAVRTQMVLDKIAYDKVGFSSPRATALHAAITVTASLAGCRTQTGSVRAPRKSSAS